MNLFSHFFHFSVNSRIYAFRIKIRYSRIVFVKEEEFSATIWQAIFYYIFDMKIINASIVYFNSSSASNNSSEILSFCHELINEFMTILSLKSCKNQKINHKKECAWCQKIENVGKRMLSKLFTYVLNAINIYVCFHFLVCIIIVENLYDC